MERAVRHTGITVRGLVGLAVGLIVGFLAGNWLNLPAAMLAGWTAAALTASIWALLVVWPMDAAATRVHATAEDPGRRISSLVALLGSAASLGGLVIVLIEHTGAKGAMAFALAGLALVSVAASWLLIQTVYVLRLADTYYREPVGGISFNQDGDPAYTDFVYVAFGVGLTYQVADTNVHSNDMRRVIIAQSLLAYLFGAVLLGTVINLLAGL